MNTLQSPSLATTLCELHISSLGDSWDAPSEPSEIKIGQMIMVISNDRFALTMIANRLQSDGYHVFAVAHSQDALAQMRILRPTALILDERISQNEGWNILDELSRDPQVANIPIILK